MPPDQFRCLSPGKVKAMDNNKKTRDELLTELAEVERQLAALAPIKAAQQEATEGLARQDEEVRRLTEELNKERAECSHLKESYQAFLEQSAEGIYLMETDAPISTSITEEEQITAYFNT